MKKRIAEIKRGENAETILEEMTKLFWNYTEKNDKLLTKFYKLIKKQGGHSCSATTS